jgi:hypothetical protein
VALAIVVVALLHVAQPAKYRVNPPVAGPAVLLGLLAAPVIGDPGRIDRQKTWLRIGTSGTTRSRPGYAGDRYAALRPMRDVSDPGHWKP